MPATIDIQHEVLTYSAVFERPVMNLWGVGSGNSGTSIPEILARSVPAGKISSLCWVPEMNVEQIDE